MVGFIDKGITLKKGYMPIGGKNEQKQKLKKKGINRLSTSSLQDES